MTTSSVALLFVLMTGASAMNLRAAVLREEQVSKQVHLPVANCEFSIRKDGPKGEAISGASLHTSLYYRIACDPGADKDNYCLMVTNCTVSGPGEEPYPIIDELGCSLEPWLFEHVEYEDDFTAGIHNPTPVRFRGPSGKVRFHCNTALSAKLDGKCSRHTCTWNEYKPDLD
uniref:ZP domain-containing protein n=1 Tax=Plectus sambesii TaxID=2011161 RepID=A0A914UP01_9BILA